MTKKQFNIELLSLITIMALLFGAVCLGITWYKLEADDLFIWELGLLGLILAGGGYSLMRFVVFYIKSSHHD